MISKCTACLECSILTYTIIIDQIQANIRFLHHTRAKIKCVSN